MSDIESTVPVKKASRLKTIVFIVLLALLLLVLVGFVKTWLGSDKTPSSNEILPTNSQTKSPDPVKDSAGPNGDTMPSGTGTGPGSDNSLLSQ